MRTGDIESLDAGLPDPRVLLRAAAMIRHGGLVAHPTETFYGLAVDPFSEAAVERLRAAKGLDAGRAVLLLLTHRDAVNDLARLEGIARTWFESLARAFWPGPLTLILPARPGLRCPALGAETGVAVRVSSHPVALQLARTVGGPITSTSANRTGDAPAADAESIGAGLRQRIDLVLDGGRCPGGLPSTLLDLTGDRPRVARAGAVETAALRSVLGFLPAAEA
jgi:L-threonylcarbamoyladenylate synthase